MLHNHNTLPYDHSLKTLNLLFLYNRHNNHPSTLHLVLIILSTLILTSITLIFSSLKIYCCPIYHHLSVQIQNHLPCPLKDHQELFTLFHWPQKLEVLSSMSLHYHLHQNFYSEQIEDLFLMQYDKDHLVLNHQNPQLHK